LPCVLPHSLLLLTCLYYPLTLSHILKHVHLFCPHLTSFISLYYSAQPGKRRRFIAGFAAFLPAPYAVWFADSSRAKRTAASLHNLCLRAALVEQRHARRRCLQNRILFMPFRLVCAGERCWHRGFLVRRCQFVLDWIFCVRWLRLRHTTLLPLCPLWISSLYLSPPSRSTSLFPTCALSTTCSLFSPVIHTVTYCILLLLFYNFLHVVPALMLTPVTCNSDPSVCRRVPLPP